MADVILPLYCRAMQSLGVSWEPNTVCDTCRDIFECSSISHLEGLPIDALIPSYNENILWAYCTLCW